MVPILDLLPPGISARLGHGRGNQASDPIHYVVRCEGGTAVVAAHPLRPELDGEPAARTLVYGPKPGDQIGADFCAAARRPHGGWIEYDFPGPGETRPERKVNYSLAVPGTPYAVGAGLHDESARVEDLDRLADGRP